MEHFPLFHPFLFYRMQWQSPISKMVLEKKKKKSLVKAGMLDSVLSDSVLSVLHGADVLMSLKPH